MESTLFSVESTLFSMERTLFSVELAPSKHRIFSFIFLDVQISANQCELMRNKISGKKLGNAAF